MVSNQAVFPSSPQWSLQANPLRTDIRLLFQAAMLVFVITVGIGILNGLHLVGQLSQDVLLTHVHAGTLGWITLSVFAVCLWLFSEGKAPTEKSRSVLIITTLTGVYASFEVVPSWLFFALDHAMFIGVMSNALFGLIQIVTQERRSFWPWADDILFWGMNFGMVGFVISLLLDASLLERIFTPIMGLSILLALLTYTLRMRRPSEPEAIEVTVGA